MNTPNGLDEIVATFGDVQSFARADGTLSPQWNALYLDHALLPFSIPLDWNRAVSVDKIYCHKLMVPIFDELFQEIVDEGLQSKVQTYGGCFMYRPQRTGTKLSTHAWGIAIDLNPSTNTQGTSGDMDSGVVQVFKDAGFEYGGDWSGTVRDPMHFQYATNY